MPNCPALAIITLELERDRLADYAAACDRQILAVGRINADYRQRMREAHAMLVIYAGEGRTVRKILDLLEDKEESK